MKQRCCAVLVAALLAAGVALPATAQRPTGAAARPQTELGTELARIRDATVLENSGDLRGAEAIVRQILQQNPASLTALLTFERLLAVQGRTVELLPVVDRLIELEPYSVIGHQVRLRARAQLNDIAGVEAASAAWIRATPNIETPYRESAQVWRQLNDGRRAVAVLEQGRKRIDRSDALALELGDAHAAAGDLPRAVAEWARAVGHDGRGFLLVQRRLQTQPDGGARAIPLLIDQLSAGSPSVGRRRAAALLALEAGLEERAERLARELAAQVPAAEREQLLVELARRADAAGLYRIAIRAYEELLLSAREPGAALAVRTRLAELSLLAGDTARAAEVYRHLETASAAGSPQRRQAMALRLQLGIREGDLARAAEELSAFRSEFPQAPEIDRTAALLATAWLDAGDIASAERVLAGVSGAHSAQVRGRIYIRTGNLAAARDELLRAAPQLQGSDATETIALAALLMRVSPAGGELIARAIGATDEERQRLIDVARTETVRLPASERAAILDFVAAVAERAGLHEDATALRHEIVTKLPRTHEAPGALLALARQAMSEPAAADEATVLLEKLILEYPRSALAPQARRELERLNGRSAAH